jgi:hypothetical protein
MPEREGGGAICDGHALFYCLDIVTTTGRSDSAGAVEKDWPMASWVYDASVGLRVPMKIYGCSK